MKKVLSGDFLLKNWMSIVFLGSVLLAAMLTAGCSAKTQKPAVAEQVEEVDLKDYQEIECRSKAVTGSRFKRKVCATKAEWAAIDKKNAKGVEALERGMRSNSTADGPSTDPMGGSTMGQMPR